LSTFKFADVNKILPFSDPACPPDGICDDKLQVLMKFHLTQTTDVWGNE
jgi:hypothetical protein